MKEIFLVDIFILTYNHERYIERAIESVLNQKTSFKFKITIIDDQSTDQNRIRIDKYKKLFPEQVQIIYNENQLGITKNYKKIFELATCKYTALLEGDDYWLSCKKLQQSVDFLETHFTANMCFHSFIGYQEDINHVFESGLHLSGTIFSTRDLILDNFIGNFSTCTYRTSALKAIPPKVFTYTAYDWLINSVIGDSGLIGRIPEPLSIYSIHSNGAWTRKTDTEKIENILEQIPIFKDIFGTKYLPQLKELEKRNKHLLLRINFLSRFNLMKRGIYYAHFIVPSIFFFITGLFFPPFIFKRIRERFF